MRVEQEEQEQLDSYLATALENMENIMRIPKHNKKSTPLQLAINLIREGAIESFADFEQLLSHRASGIHFIALPLDYFSGNNEVAFPYGDQTKRPSYVLKITMGGDLEARKLLKDLKISPQENLERLKKTGVIQIPASTVPANNR